ncbi:hypothetical protein TNCV_2167741 [Trichonephila clavipes]|nr:hypothetical protein TNCV_2167741 [Trichonephila clavipes]
MRSSDKAIAEDLVKRWRGSCKASSFDVLLRYALSGVHADWARIFWSSGISNSSWGNGRKMAVPTVKKRRRNIVLSFSHDSMTTARLKIYNVHRAIGAQRTRDQMSRDLQGWPKNKRSKKD